MREWALNFYTGWINWWFDHPLVFAVLVLGFIILEVVRKRPK